jgi:glycosyltransferase involved in cell wall biosynthesis
MENSPMTILLDLPSLRARKTGIPYFIFFLTRALLAQAITEKFIIWAPEDIRHLEVQSRNCVWRRRFLPRRFLERIWKIYPLRSGSRAVDIYHLLYPAQPTPRSRSTKLVVTIYDLAWTRFPETAASNEAAQAMTSLIAAQAAEADAIIAISHSTKTDLQKILQIPENKIHVIYPGCDLSAPTAESAKIDRENFFKALPKRYILCVGTWEPRKNLANLLRAVKILQAKMKAQNVALCLAGGKGWNYQATQSLIGELGIEDSIMTLDYAPREYLPALYAGALYFVYPSLYEGFGLPVLEAMTCGAPVITSNVSSLPEVGGDAALYINPNSVAELAGAMEKLLDDEILRAQMKQKGFTRAEMFSWEKAARETLELYREVTS